jgi:predicted transcriptional regulator
MHKIYNPKNLLNKPLLISYGVESLGENAKIIDIGDNQYRIVFEACPEDDEDDFLVWVDQEPEFIINNKAFFRNIGQFNFYLQIEEQEQEQEQTVKKLEYNKDMKTTVKELSEKLGLDVVYVNGFLQTLLKIGKAEIIGKVERPVGQRGKPSNIYQIQEGIIE